MRNCIVIMLAVLLTSCVMPQHGQGRTKIVPQKELRFTGEDIFDSETGVIITKGKEKSFLVVANYKLDYAFPIPYSTGWTFTNDKRNDVVLAGNTGDVHIFLKILPYGGSQHSYLQTFQEALNDKKAFPGLIESEIITHEGYPVLKAKIDGGRENPKWAGYFQLSYYGAKKKGKQIYFLHYSDIVAKKELSDFKDKNILVALTKGFSVNFMK